MTKLITAVVALVVALGFVGCGGDDETTPATATTETTETQTTETTTTEEEPAVAHVVVEDGVPQGGILRQTVSQGDQVAIVVDSDVADEIHVHGYDLSQEVEAGGTARIEFEATIPGRVEVELEDRGVQIAELTVEP